uniref:PH domain-containing protein n=1 Tax=Peronospora matthiolae TaxID=2874970 RepID=A0AAV1UM30_9STRA
MEQSAMPEADAVQGSPLPEVLSPEGAETVAGSDALNAEEETGNTADRVGVTAALVIEEAEEAEAGAEKDATDEKIDVDVNVDVAGVGRFSSFEELADILVDRSVIANGGTIEDDDMDSTVEESVEEIVEEQEAVLAAYADESNDDVRESESETLAHEHVSIMGGGLAEADAIEAEADQDVETLDDPLTFVTLEPFGDVEAQQLMDVEDYSESSLLINGDAAEGLIGADDVVENQSVATLAVVSPEGALRFPQEVAPDSPAVRPDLPDGVADQITEDINDLAALDANTEMESDEQDEDEDANEHGEHATITAVTESAEKLTPVDANLEAVLEKIRTKLPCKSVEVLETGEILALPKGWSTRQSKSNDGKTYYVSPYGHTQWLRPPMKTGAIYNWVHEIEVTFGHGRLGLNLKQIAGVPGTVFTDLQVHIAEIYKLPNGMASPAEIYNWSMKPEKRLAVNMRVTMMNGIPLTGYTYSEVLELLARLVRPVRIKFADITKGIVGRVEEEALLEETEEVKEARAARVMQNSLRKEYFQVLVCSELHKQVWSATNHHMYMKRLEMEKKCEIMETQVESVQRRQESLGKERENLIQEECLLTEMIEKLDKQAAGEIESPEVLRTAELVQRSMELEKDVTELIAENNALRAVRAETEQTLDNLQNELDKYGDLGVDLNSEQEIKFFSPAFLGSMVNRGSIDTRAADAREQLLIKVKAQCDHLEEEIEMEAERTGFVESEIYQFRNQMDVAAAAVKREDAFISGERPPQLIFLENKIALLRKSLRETVAGIAKATGSGDQQQADNLSLRRADLKDDLKAALDEMLRMQNELQVFFDVDQGKNVVLPSADSSIDTIDIDEAPQRRLSESTRLQTKLGKLQTKLHEIVIELAKAAGDNDEERKSELSKQRLQLKDEMKVVQDQFQALTNGTLNVSTNATEAPPRTSITGPPPQQEAARRNTVGARVSVGGIRSSFGGRVSMIGAQIVQGVSRQSATVQRGSERFDPDHSRGSSSSVNSFTQDSANQIGLLPAMSGILRKHPTHSNEKGTFGNMSLRGVRVRWCNIEPDGYLRYYKREGDREPRGAIPLKHKSLEILHGKDVGKPHEFMICSPTQQTRLVAKNQEEMLKWVKVLGLAHAYFRKRFNDGRKTPGSVSSSNGSTADQPANATSPEAADAELAYRNKRATLGF